MQGTITICTKLIGSGGASKSKGFQPRQAPYADAEDQRVLPPCAPRLLTGGGYNRHHYEVEVRLHMRASVYT